MTMGEKITKTNENILPIVHWNTTAKYPFSSFICSYRKALSRKTGV